MAGREPHAFTQWFDVLTIERSSGPCPSIQPSPHLSEPPRPRLLRDLQWLGELPIVRHPAPKRGLADTQKFTHRRSAQQLIVVRTDMASFHRFVQKNSLSTRERQTGLETKKTRARRAFSWNFLLFKYYINPPRDQKRRSPPRSLEAGI